MAESELVQALETVKDVKAHRCDSETHYYMSVLVAIPQLLEVLTAIADQ